MRPFHLNSTFAAFCLSLVFLLAPGPAMGGPEFAGDSEHRGIVAIDSYQIFPENRPGNAIYLNKRLVISRNEQTIVALKPLVKEGRFAYLTRNVFGNLELGVHLPPTDPAPKVKKVGENFYYVVMVVEQVVYKKLYRIVQENAIVDVLPNSKTADGVVAGESGILFYHVANAITTEQDGRTVYEFALRLHIVMFAEERLRNLDYPIINSLPRLKLAWNGTGSVQYTLADGRVEVLSLAQFQ